MAVLKGLAIMPQASPCFVLTCIDLTFGFLQFSIHSFARSEFSDMARALL